MKNVTTINTNGVDEGCQEYGQIIFAYVVISGHICQMYFSLFTRSVCPAFCLCKSRQLTLKENEIGHVSWYTHVDRSLIFLWLASLCVIRLLKYSFEIMLI